MKKKFTKLMAALALLTFLAVPMGMWGQTRAEGDTHDFSQTLQQLLNNNASISSINIAEQDYPVKKVTVSYRYNNSITDAVTMEVTVNGVSWGTFNVNGTGKNYATQDFTGSSTTGAIVISFKNNTGNGTGHGTFYVNNVRLTEGSSATITSLSYTGAPNKTEYEVGESFDPTGLTVTATYSDASTQDVTSSVVWTPNPLTQGTTSVTGTYSGQSVVINGITVTAPAEPNIVLDKNNKPYTSTSGSNTDVVTTTLDGIEYQSYAGYIYNNYLSFNRSQSGAYLGNNTQLCGNIKKIVVDYYQGGSSYFTMYEGTSALAETTMVSPSSTGTGKVTYTFSGNNGYFKFKLTTTGTYCNINSISIYLNDCSIYHVTYNANGATGDVPVDDTEYDDDNNTVTVLGPGNLAKTGYGFSGWNTVAEGSGISYNEGATFEITGNTTLYAQWSINKHIITMPSNDLYGTYSLSYNYNNSTVTSATDVPYGVEVTLNYTPADGYENYVATWSVNNSSISGNTFTMPDEDVTVTVSVEENPFTIATLSGNDMKTMTREDNSLDYYKLKYTTVSGFYWETNGQQAQSNNIIYGMIQIRDRGNTNGISYIKLPEFNGKIEEITFTVTNGSATSSTGAACKAKLNFQTSTSPTETISISGGNTSSGTNSITLDFTNAFYSTGYITASSAAARIWNISVTYRPYKDMTGTELTAIDADRTVSIPANTNATAIDLTIPASSGIIIKSGASLTVSGTLTNSGNANNLVIEDGGQLISNSSVQATVKKSIAGHTRGTTGWNFIATTAVDGTTPTTANGILDATPANYDLFYYDEPYHYWRNYKDNEGHTNNDAGFVSDGGKLLNGKGYLYANANNAELSFEGATVAANKKIDLTLSYSDANLSFRGFNLVGNPFTYQLTSSSEITLNGTDFNTYYMIENGEEIKSTTISETPINPGTGFIVQADAENQHLVFNPDGVSKGERASKPSFIRIDAGNDGFMDRAYIQFGNVNTLRKFTLNDNTPKVYVMNNNLDWATTVINETVGEMPVCFKAVTDGQYTISVKPEGVEVSYLHLIDNIAGTDIDLLANPSYTFNAKADDYKSRFRLVFSAKSDNDTNLNEDFAFFSDGQLIVTGEGTLQVVDMMGRVISSEIVNGTTSKTIDAKAGVYVLRLINGENVKTQKIVVR